LNNQYLEEKDKEIKYLKDSLTNLKTIQEKKNKNSEELNLDLKNDNDNLKTIIIDKNIKIKEIEDISQIEIKSVREN